MALALSTAGCEKKSPEREPGEGLASSTTAAPSLTTPENTAGTEKLSQLAEKDIRAVVDRWLSSQNAGNFEEYEKLFAQRFEGVKRVGGRLESFDRKAWLADRAKMFQRDFTVSLSDLQIAASGAVAVVEFVQTWTSATFQDKGPKRLIIARGVSGLQIAKEEMLRSTLVGEEKQAYQVDPRRFAFVWDDLIIVDELQSLSGVIGHPAPTSNNTTSRPVDVSLLPAASRSLLGEEFVLYGKSGELCRARVKNLHVHVEVQPHFGQEQQWSGFEGRPPVSPMQRALQLWELSAMGGRFLAAELDVPANCGEALWARSAQLPAPTLWTSREPTPEEKKKILKEVRAQARYQEEQRAYHGPSGSTVPWEETEGGTLQILAFEGPGGAQYADVSMFHSGGGCGANYEGVFWAIVRKKGEGYVSVNAAPGEHVESSWPRMLKGMRSDVAFDLDADGIPEFMGGYDLIRSVDGTFRAVQNQSPSNFDCPC